MGCLLYDKPPQAHTPFLHLRTFSEYMTPGPCIQLHIRNVYLKQWFSNEGDIVPHLQEMFGNVWRHF